MKNKLFFSSLFITAMLFADVNSSFALSDTLQMNVPGFFSVEVDSSSVLSGTLSYKSSDTVTIDSPLSITFNVATSYTELAQGFGNCVSDCQSNGVEIYTRIPRSSWGSQSTPMDYGFIVFEHTSSNPSIDAVRDVWGNTPAAENNAGLIAFPISCTESNAPNSYRYASGFGTNNISGMYEVNGELSITCTIIGDSIPGTYGANDPTGNYVAEIILSELYDSLD